MFKVPRGSYEIIRKADNGNTEMKFIGRDEALALIRNAEMKRKPGTSLVKIKRDYAFVVGLAKEALTELLPVLPDPGTDIYILSNGHGAEKNNGAIGNAFDFGSFVPYLVDMVTPEGRAHVYISTWTMNHRNVDNMVKARHRGQIDRLVVCTDPYFNSRDPETALMLLSAMRDEDLYIAFRNHAKVICVENSQTGSVVTVTGSANLSSQPRVEQFVVSTSRKVFDFFKLNLFDWAIAQFRQHQQS